MDTFQQHFGDIRSRLAEAPTAVSFFRVCKALLLMWRDSPARVNDEVVPYLIAHMDHWPSHMRAHPAFWEKIWLRDDATSFAPLSLIATLDLSHRRISDDLTRWLLAAESLDSLEAIDLAGNNLAAAHADTIAHADHLRSPAHLVLDFNPIQDEGLIPFLTFPELTTIRAINTGVSSHFLRALAALNPDTSKLHTLVLCENTFDSDAVAALASAPILNQLRLLDLSRCNLQYEDASLLMKAAGKQLTVKH